MEYAYIFFLFPIGATEKGAVEGKGRQRVGEKGKRRILIESMEARTPCGMGGLRKGWGG